MDAPECPSFKVTRDQLKNTDFLTFVQKTFREHPDLPMFKIVPPSDWSPTKRRPNLDQLIIQTPIKQLVRSWYFTPHGLAGPQFSRSPELERAGIWQDRLLSMCSCRR